MPPAAAIDALIRPLLWLALGLLHLLALVLALVPAFPPRRRRSSPSSSSSAAASASTKPPPRHVQLLLIAPSASARTSDARNAAVDRLLVESVARAVDWATAEGVTELSVFEPSDLLPKLHGELVFRLTARPPTPPSSTPSSPPFPVDRRPLRPTEQILSHPAAQAYSSDWKDGWITIECARPAGDSARNAVRSDPAGSPSVVSPVLLQPTSSAELRGLEMHPASNSTSGGLRHRNPASSSTTADVPTDAQRLLGPFQRRPLQVHLLTTQSGQPLLTELARSFAAEPDPPEIDVGSVTAALGRRLPFSHLDPDLLIIHRLEPYGVDDRPTASSSYPLPSLHARDRSPGPSRLAAPADPGSRPAYWSPARLARRWASSLARAAAVRASDRPGSTWFSGGDESVQLYGVGIWGLRVTEIYQTSPRTAEAPSPRAGRPSRLREDACRALDREDWARAMDAWRGIEQRYGR